MTSPGAKKARRWEAAISSLMTEPTLGAAAKAAHIGEKTLRRWLADPEFQAAYRLSRRQVLEGAIGTLQQAACVRRAKSNTDSGGSRTPLPTQAEHRFRAARTP